ncbi:hypothetical protein [Sphaerisporangium corydalis]|uniref:Uncharacterized protein n=1 Tax=Sphaerisporangium corydalis TaxID=1441875 RepID=A0ABV9EAC8_9ACTN|nr:hypothetical protein [Sphaerisporangium corydalis]
MATSTGTIIRRTGVAVTAGLLAGLVGMGMPAAGAAALPGSAAALRASSSSGSCSKGGASINFSAYYHNSSRYHVFTSFAWTIAGSGVHNKNNVQVRVKYDNARGHDPIYWTWISPDNIRKGRSTLNSGTRNGGNPVPASGVRVPKSKKAYTEFKAVFDKSGTDPRCTGHTRNI